MRVLEAGIISLISMDFKYSVYLTEVSLGMQHKVFSFDIVSKSNSSSVSVALMKLLN